MTCTQTRCSWYGALNPPLHSSLCHLPMSYNHDHHCTLAIALIRHHYSTAITTTCVAFLAPFFSLALCNQTLGISTTASCPIKTARNNLAAPVCNRSDGQAIVVRFTQTNKKRFLFRVYFDLIVPHERVGMIYGGHIDYNMTTRVV